MSASNRPVATVTTNIPELQAAWTKFDRLLIAALPDLVKEALKYEVEELIKYTPPIKGNQLGQPLGGTAEAKKQGEANVARDIDMMFRPLQYTSLGDLVMARNEDAVWAYDNMIFESKRLQKAWDTRNMDELYHAFESNGWEYTEEDFDYVEDLTEADAVGARAEYRNNSGAMADAFKNNRSVRTLVKNQKTIEAVKKLRQATVGKMVGGWVKVLKALGGTPKENFGGNGIGIIKSTGFGTTKPMMTADNPHADYNNIMANMGILPRIASEAEKRTKIALQKKIDEIIKKTSNSGTPPRLPGTPPPLPGQPPPLPPPLPRP